MILLFDRCVKYIVATAVPMAGTVQKWQHLVAQCFPAGLLGIVAFALALEITDPLGPGLDPDALHYLGAAESLTAYATYRVPIATWDSADSTSALAHFPPGYPTAIALGVRLGMPPIQSARLVQATAAFVTITTLVLLVSAAATPLAGILLAACLFATPPMHEVHASVLSEPLFLACLALTVATMAWRPDRPLWAGIAAAIGAITRYAGASLVGAVVLWALTQQGSVRERLRRAATALFPALVLEGWWVVRTRVVAGSGEIREFALYGNLGPTLSQGAATLTAWLVPDPNADLDPIPHRGTIAVAAAIALAALIAIGSWHTWRTVRGLQMEDDPRAPLRWQLLRAGALVLVCYVAVVIASRVTADPSIPLDARILAPGLVLVTTLGSAALGAWWCRTRQAIPRIAVGAALLCWGGASIASTYDEAREALEQGSDFAGEQWRKSELLAWARTSGVDRPLYSNWPSAVYLHLHRPVRELPRDSRAVTLAAFADTLRVRDGRVLVFDVPATEFTANAALLNAPGLRQILRTRDGVVLAPSSRSR